MKSLFALPMLMLALVSFQASAACLYIADSFTGIAPPQARIFVYGPFTITPANGCSTANIEARISAAGVGRAPEIYIERQVGASWKRETFNLGGFQSYQGAFGTYRVAVYNGESASKAFSGTVKYGR